MVSHNLRAVPARSFVHRPAAPWRIALAGVSITVCLMSAHSVHAETAAPAGQAVFERQCAVCHQVGGKGLPGMAPALARTLAPLVTHEEGRRYLLQVLVHGLSGRIVSQGQVFMGAMPPQSTLSDTDLAEVANYLVQDLNGVADTSFAASDFAATRADRVTHRDLREMRSRLLK